MSPLAKLLSSPASPPELFSGTGSPPSAIPKSLTIYPCRLLCVLRCTQPHITLSGADTFDSGLRRVFEDLQGAIPSRCWKIAQLPLRMGGLGLTSTSLLSDVCYISSVLSSLPLIQGLLPSMSFPSKTSSVTICSTLPTPTASRLASSVLVCLVSRLLPVTWSTAIIKTWPLMP